MGYATLIGIIVPVLGRDHKTACALACAVSSASLILHYRCTLMGQLHIIWLHKSVSYIESYAKCCHL